MTTNLVPFRTTQQAPTSAISLGHRHQQSSLSPVRRMALPNGDRGTEATIAKMRELIQQGMRDQLINRQAFAIVNAAGVQSFDFPGEIRAVFGWVSRNIRFFQDVDGVETLRTPREVLTIRGGDCDDYTVLIAALLGTIGHNVRIVTVSSDADAPGVFSHVYPEVEINGQWVPLDAARRDAALGKAPSRYFRKRVWSINDSRFRDVSGLSGYFAPAQTRTGRRVMRRLGDFSDIASGIADLIGAGGTAAAGIINATSGGIRASIPGFVTNPATGQLVPINPAGQLQLSTAPGGLVAAGAGSIPNWLLYGGMGLGAILLLQAVKR